jgi:hypothetical protein
MSCKFQSGSGDWIEYRQLPGLVDLDLHYADNNPVPFHEKMARVHREALEALQGAQANGKEFLLIRHGHSTSRPGRTTARSVVRALMRSKEATPFIVRKACTQHYSVFVATIRHPKRPVAKTPSIIKRAAKRPQSSGGRSGSGS